jgi:hypothetical protein
VNESTAESIAHPVAFGAAMLMMFINWMVLGPPDGSWAWVEHLIADLSVLALMGGVAVATSCVRSGWWPPLGEVRRGPVRMAAVVVRNQVDETERPHRAAGQVAGFLAAAAAFALTGEATDRPLLTLGVVLCSFVGAQVAVMMLLRPRAESSLRRALDVARVGLSESERLGLSEELGLEPE